MTTLALLERLVELEITVAVRNGRLVVSAPVGALADDLRQELARHRQDLIAMLGPDSGPSLPRASQAERPWPLGSGQQRLWFLNQATPSSAAYNAALYYRLAGPLDRGALTAAFQDLLNRHDILRTSFPDERGRPAQRVADVPQASLALIDFRGSTDDSGLAHRALLEDVIAKPFNLETGPCIRAALVQLDVHRFEIVIVLHHIVCDGWSLTLLAEELSALYAARTTASTALEPPAVQFGDYAAWESAPERLEQASHSLTYWKTQFATPPPILQFPSDAPRGASGHAGTTATLRLDDTFVARLDHFARVERTTPFVVLVAGFAALLRRVCDEHDIAIGTPSANRPRPEFQRTIGPFVNVLPLRLAVRDTASFRQLVHHVREVCRDALTHQEVPFERVVQHVRPRRDWTPHQPLFQCACVLHDRRGPELAFARVTTERRDVPQAQALFDLTLSIDRTNDHLTLSFVFDQHAIDAELGKHLLHWYECLLADWVANPDTGIGNASQLSATLRRLLLERGRGPAPTPDIDACGAFLRCAHERPDATAVVMDGQHLSYGALQQSASVVASALRARGIGMENRVAIVLPRSVDLVAAVVGVAQTGAAFVCLDTTHPDEHLRTLIARVGASAVLTDAATTRRLHGLDVPPLIVSAEHRESFECAHYVTPPSDSLAYVVYTSGSTGEPKGVAVPHAALRNLTAWHLRAFDTSKADRTTLVASPAFDAFVWELWPALAAGAAICIPSTEALASRQSLAAWLEREAVTHTFLPTPLAERLLSEPAMFPPAVRALLTGGDALRVKPDATVRADVFNQYGPTENGVVSTWTPRGIAAEPWPRPSVGVPIDGTDAYVVDSAMQLVPPGVAGELYVGGCSLARGYWNAPDLTAARFLPHPWSEVPGARLFRTGDRVRWHGDGTLEFLGRVDRQIQIHGVRIEPAEVEAVLAAHPSVRACAVAPRENGGHTRLVAYIEARGDTPDREELRRHMAQRLPAYSRPAAFVFLPTLPLSSNGKIDRNALPAAVPGIDGCAAAPETDLQRAVAGIWQQLLGVNSVGLYDNFFDLGGHSMLLVELWAQLRATFGCDLPLVEMFDHPTVDAVCRRLHTGPASPAFPQVMAAADRQRRSFAQLARIHASRSQDTR